MPATPAMANRQCTSSACTYHFKAAGSSPSPRGSKPKSPGSLQFRDATTTVIWQTPSPAKSQRSIRVSDNRRAVEVSRRVQAGQPGRALGAGPDDDPSSRRPHAVCGHGERAPAPTSERPGSCCYNGRHGCHRGCCSPAAELTNSQPATSLPLACLLLSFGGRWWMLGWEALSGSQLWIWN